MRAENMHPVALSAHPATPADAVRSLQARVGIREGEVLAIEYTLTADLARLRIPPPKRDPHRADDLWKNTCFEAFVVTDESPGYYELNYSPSGDWAAYRFSAYRTGRVPADGIGVPEIAVETGADRLRLEAAIPIEALRHARSMPGLPRINLAAVIQSQEGTLSYWAQHHPPGKPDFHQRESLAFEIPT